MAYGRMFDLSHSKGRRARGRGISRGRTKFPGEEIAFYKASNDMNEKQTEGFPDFPASLIDGSPEVSQRRFGRGRNRGRGRGNDPGRGRSRGNSRSRGRGESQRSRMKSEPPTYGQTITEDHSQMSPSRPSTYREPIRYNKRKPYPSKGRFHSNRRGHHCLGDTVHSHRTDEWLFELQSLENTQLVDELDDNLKPFQNIINKPRGTVPDLKITSAIIRLLTRLAESGLDSKEAANRILAECLHHDRCSEFHAQLLHSVHVATQTCDRNSQNFLLMLSNLCCLLLDQYQWQAYSVLPVPDIQRALTKLTDLSMMGQEKFVKATQDLAVRIEHIQTNQIVLHEDIDAEEEDAGYTYHITSILPDLDELTSVEDPDIPYNIVTGRYQSWNHYYDTQFHLLREDFVHPLRRGICDYYRGLRGRDLQDIRIYQDVRVLQPLCTKDGVSYVVKFNTTRLRHVRWDKTKRLMYGSLVCLLANFSKAVILASVVCRESEEISKGYICIKPEGETECIPWNHYNTYTMVESSAYFEAYRHILASLQNAEVDTMPFKQYLIDVKWDRVDMPVYIRNYISKQGTSPSYDLSSALGCGDLGGRSTVMIVDSNSWPHHSDTQLDPSQMEAMKMAFTQEIALIQGPPGTGKTYMGIKIVDALCNNSKVWNPDGSSPILVVCYTNHALDQFLNGIKEIKIPTSHRFIRIARVGGRADAGLAEFALRKIRRGIIPDEEYYKLRNLQDAVKEEGEALSNLLKSLNKAITGIQNVHNLARFVSADHLEQLQNNCPGESPDMALNVWLGLFSEHVMREPEPDGDHSDSDHTNGDDLDRDEKHMEQPDEEHYEQPGEQSCKQPDQEQWKQPGEYQLEQEDEEHLKQHAEEPGGCSPFDDPFEQCVIEYSGNMQSLESLKDEEPVESDGSSSYDRELIEVEDEQAIEEDSRRLDIGDQTGGMKLSIEALQTGTATELPTVKSKTHWLKVENYAEQIQKIHHMQPFSSKDVDRIININALDTDQRWRLYAYWVSQMQSSDIQIQFHEYNKLCQECQAFDQEQDRHALEKVQVIGMTTTGAAKYQHILHLIKPKIVIIEEAAEVLESHIISCLTANTQHLILIGDHQQLRPKPNVYELATKYNLDISLFERLVRNNFPRVTLEIQHRMRPEIAQLVHPQIYPVLENHSSVCTYDSIKGICTNMYFIDHCQLEKANDELKSHSNVHEAEFMSRLCRYLIQQGYRPSQITILCAYTGQLLEVQRYMPKSLFHGVCIRTLDNYQGEENDIVLLTLVRSNELRRIGFLKATHRVCVALSRAKMGFYCIGNFQMFEAEAEIWSKLIPLLRRRNKIGASLQLCCQNHPQVITDVGRAEDFSKVPEGGCLEDCTTRLQCGHSCGRKCHHDDMDHSCYRCTKRCSRTCEREHPCREPCFKCFPSTCPPCTELVEKTLPLCGHIATVRCYKNPQQILCTKRVEVICSRGHVVHRPCHKQKNPCEVPVEVLLPCGHTQNIKCSDDPGTAKCESPCNKKLQCGHQCSKRCYEECCTNCPEMVEKQRYCGHILWTKCSDDVNETICTEPCTKMLKCGHNCRSTCSLPCQKYCNHQIQETLPCGHSNLRKCSSTKEPYCTVDVSRELKCGHLGNMPCGLNVTEFKCKKKKTHNLPCGHKKKLQCCNVDSYECNVQIEISRRCGHPLQVPCAKQKDPIPNCQAHCYQILACGHPCNGDCTTCFGGYFHKTCSTPVTLHLPCGHILRDVKCSEQYSTKCKAKCPIRCGHEEGQVHQCTSGCWSHVDCEKPCNVSCIHREPCEEECSVICGSFPFCDEHCPKVLECRHPCEGMCGEPCPKMCRKCQQGQRGRKKKGKGKKQAAKFTFQSQMGHDVDLTKPDLHFVQLDCGHIFEVGFLDAFMTHEMEAAKKVGIKLCPKCGNRIMNMYRYRNITKKTWILVYLVDCKKANMKTISFIYPQLSVNFLYDAIMKIKDDQKLEEARSVPLVFVNDRYLGSAEQKQSFLMIDSLARDVNSLLSSYAADIESPYRSLPRILVEEVLESVKRFSTIGGKGILKITNPQSVHDWIKEVWRIQLLIGLCDCLVKSGSSSSSKSLRATMETLCNRPYRQAALPLKEVYSIEQQLRKCSDGKFALSFPISQTQIPMFSGSTWYQCPNGHLYSKFTVVDVDIFQNIQNACPQCNSLRVGDNYVIGKV